MAHANDDHNKADAYHHMAGKPGRAHEGSQSRVPIKQDTTQTSGTLPMGTPLNLGAGEGY